MGWKDAGDAVVYPDGSQVKGPKALCELQGYVFDAKQRLAEAADHFGDAAWAGQLRREAAALQAKFEEHFWCEDVGFYAYALDGDKQPVKTIASNAGHLLWSGIVRPDRAERVVRRLMEPDMWSGWGIRTLSETNPAYNPFSYQNGSVWPHDNGIIAMGFKRYGFAKEAGMLARDISEAGSYFGFHRLPELYAGVTRAEGTFPVQYLGANVPQAWAAGSVFHLLRAILGLDPNAQKKQLTVNPASAEVVAGHHDSQAQSRQGAGRSPVLARRRPDAIRGLVVGWRVARLVTSRKSMAEGHVDRQSSRNSLLLQL